jgi:hypothetical protein
MRLLCTLFLLAALTLPAETRLGKPLTQNQPIAIGQLLSQAERYTGQTVQVKGKVTEVCQMMGCWMELVDSASGKSVVIKVNDGDIVFPPDAAGKMAVAEGKLTKVSLNKEQALARAKHEAEERGRPFKPGSVKGPVAFYQIEGTGAVLQD